MKSLIIRLIKPASIHPITTHILLCIPRVLAGLSLSIEFGMSKFGLPWSTTEELGLFQVADWFPEDIAQYGGIFSLSPTLFAWLGAASEAIGGLFLAAGLGTRVAAFFISCTMLVAIFFQKFDKALEYGSTWPLLPAFGFLWIALFSLNFGSGKYGLDSVIANFLNKKKA